MNRKVLLLFSVILVTGGIFSIANYAGIRAEAKQAKSDGVARFHALVADNNPQEVTAPPRLPMSLPGEGTGFAGNADGLSDTGDLSGADDMEADDTEDSDIPMVSTGTITLTRPVTRPSREVLADEWMDASGDSDTSDWAPKRLASWNALMAEPPVQPIALLEIPSVDLQVPVYKGATDLNMDLGAGHIGGTTPIGRAGNIGISGHRDGFFRDLQHVSKGDSISLQDTRGRLSEFVIEEFSIVMPEDVSVLLPDDRERLTLVTCYPFYFVGHAPKRYIVHAVRRDS